MSEETLSNFEMFGLDSAIMRGVKDAGFVTPSPIQEKVIPMILQGRDVIGQAHTGTGKTAAFGLPAMNMMSKDRGVELLVLTPTRELAMQVSDELYRLGQSAGVRTATICGGQSYARQITLFNKGVQALSATPGRLLDLLKSNRLKNFAPSIVVLDEADEMLDMGFLEDIREIFEFLPKERQTLLFSATMPPPIRKLSESILKDPVFITVTQSDATNVDIEQRYYIIDEHEREDAVVRLIEGENPEKAIIFCRTRMEVDRLSTFFVACGYSAKGLHGDMEQPQRDEVMKSFRNNTISILVATDVAARGLDVADVTHVFNFHIPFDSKSYVHRIGRTGRAGKSGRAITLVTPVEFRKIRRIQHNIGTTIEQRLIPSLKKLRRERLKRLEDEIREFDAVDSDAAKMLNKLKEELDPFEIAARLISLHLSRQPESGPDHIGVFGERLNNILNERSRRNDGGKNDRMRKKRKFPTKSRRGGGKK